MESQVFLIKGPHTDLLRLTHFEFQRWGTRHIWEETELSGILVRAGEAEFSQTEVLSEAIVPFPGPPFTDQAGVYHI